MDARAVVRNLVPRTVCFTGLREPVCEAVFASAFELVLWELAGTPAAAFL